MVSAFYPRASSNKGKFTSCQGPELPFSPLQPLLCAGLLVSSFVARMDKGTQINLEDFLLLYILLHLCILSERSVKRCCRVLLILYILATVSGKELFSVWTKQHNFILHLLSIEHFLSSDFRVPLKLMRVETSQHLASSGHFNAQQKGNANIKILLATSLMVCRELNLSLGKSMCVPAKAPTSTGSV